jgi:hypothetical protein
MFVRQPGWASENRSRSWISCWSRQKQKRGWKVPAALRSDASSESDGSMQNQRDAVKRLLMAYCGRETGKGREE